MAALFAQSRVQRLPELGVGPSSGAARDLIFVFGAIFLVSLALLVWVRFRSRKKGHRHHHRDRSASQPAAVPPAAAGAAATEAGEDHESAGNRSRHRRRRRDHRMRNPTLAETGGLPPPRPKDLPPAAL